jgi:hypothetical protein
MRLAGTTVVLTQHVVLNFSISKGMTITKYGHDSSYIKVSHHQLRQYSLLSDKRVIYIMQKIIIFYRYYSKYYNLLYFRQTLQSEACIKYYLHYITTGDEWV